MIWLTEPCWNCSLSWVWFCHLLVVDSHPCGLGVPICVLDTSLSTFVFAVVVSLQAHHPCTFLIVWGLHGLQHKRRCVAPVYVVWWVAFASDIVPFCVCLAGCVSCVFGVAFRAFQCQRGFCGSLQLAAAVPLGLLSFHWHCVVHECVDFTVFRLFCRIIRVSPGGTVAVIPVLKFGSTSDYFCFVFCVCMTRKFTTVLLWLFWNALWMLESKLDAGWFCCLGILWILLFVHILLPWCDRS